MILLSYMCTSFSFLLKSIFQMSPKSDTGGDGDTRDSLVMVKKNKMLGIYKELIDHRTNLCFFLEEKHYAEAKLILKLPEFPHTNTCYTFGF